MTPSCTADVHTGDTRRRPAALYLFEFNRSCRLAERLVDWRTVTVVCLLPAAHVCCKATSSNTAGAAFTYSTQPSVFARSCSSNIPVQIPSRCDGTGLSCFPTDCRGQRASTGLKQNKKNINHPVILRSSASVRAQSMCCPKTYSCSAANLLEALLRSSGSCVNWRACAIKLSLWNVPNVQPCCK